MSKIVEGTVNFLLILVNAAALSYLCGKLLLFKVNKIIKNPQTGNFLFILCYFFLCILKLSVSEINTQFQWEIVIVFPFMSVLYEKNIRIKLYLLTLFWTVVELGTFVSFGIEVLFYQLASVFLNQFWPEHIDFKLAWANLASYAVFLLCYVVIVKSVLKIVVEKYPPDKKKLSGKEFFFIVMPCISGILVSFLLRLMLALEQDKIFYEYPSILFLIILCGIVLLITVCIMTILFYSMDMLYKERSDKIILKSQLDSLQEHLATVEELYGNIRSLKHDMKNHIVNIKNLIIGNKNEHEAQKYIHSIERTLSQLDFEYQTGDPVTDVIMKQKCMEMDKHGIPYDIEFFAPLKLGIDIFDISIILCNALDNAIEAGRKETCPYIKVYSYCKGRLYFIEIENAFHGALRYDTRGELLLSTKMESEYHGIGLKNIQQTAYKYQGDMEIQHQEGSFLLTIMLKGKKEQAF